MSSRPAVWSALRWPTAYRPGVAANIALIARMADLVMGLPLATADEPAPVFVPAEPAR